MVSHYKLQSLVLSLFVMGTLLATPTVRAQNSSPLVRFTPATVQVIVGQTVDVTVEVADVQGLYGYDLSLTFDPAAVQVVDADPSLDGVQVSRGTLLDSGFIAINTADNAAGTVRFVMTQLNPSEAKNGTGALVIVRLRGKLAGTHSPLTVTNAQLARRDGTPISLTLTAGAVQVIQAAPANPPPTATPTPTQIPASLTPTSTSTTEPARSGMPAAPTWTPFATPTPTPTASPATTTPMPGQNSGPLMQTLTPVPASTLGQAVVNSASPTSAPTRPGSSPDARPAGATVQPTKVMAQPLATASPTVMVAAAISNTPAALPTQALAVTGLGVVTAPDSGSAGPVTPWFLIGAALIVAVITLIMMIILMVAAMRQRKTRS